MRIALTLALLLCGGSAAPAQPEFEVASVKPSPAQDNSSNWTTREGRLNMRNVTLRTCILAAFQLNDYQLMAPDWLASERYDIVAKAAGPASDDELMAMLQKLLADRFHLTFHRAEKAVPVYDLVEAKGGHKLRESVPVGVPSQRSSRGRLAAQSSKLPQVAAHLSRMLERPVMDQTGLSGAFDFTLEWDSADPGSIFPAIQRQLGLNLEPRKEPFVVFFVDRIDRVPVAN